MPLAAEHLHKSLGWAAPLVFAKWARNLILWQIKFVQHIAQIFRFDTQVFQLTKESTLCESKSKYPIAAWKAIFCILQIHNRFPLFICILNYLLFCFGSRLPLFFLDIYFFSTFFFGFLFLFFFFWFLAFWLRVFLDF